MAPAHSNINLSPLQRRCYDIYSPTEGFDTIQLDNESWSTKRLSIENLCAEPEISPRILVAFLPAEATLLSQGIRDHLSMRFNIPASFWTPVAQEASGFFGSHDATAEDGNVLCYISHFRFLVKEPIPKTTSFGAEDSSVPYAWHRLGFVTHWTPNKTALLCFDLPVQFKNSLISAMAKSNSRPQLDDPFSIHAILIEEIINLFNHALWSWRHCLRWLEQNRSSAEKPHADYKKLHELARHIIHSSEVLAMALETMSSMIQEHSIYIGDNGSLSKAAAFQSENIARTFRYQNSLFKCLHLRSKALEERLRNEINSAFNITAQHDSRIATSISEATQVDSAAMRTISFLGFLFLPGTFICALFSTSFFNFSPGDAGQSQRWTVSEKFWIYWVVTIPVTVLTVACWFFWEKRFLREFSVQQRISRFLHPNANMHKSA